MFSCLCQLVCSNAQSGNILTDEFLQSHRLIDFSCPSCELPFERLSLTNNTEENCISRDQSGTREPRDKTEENDRLQPGLSRKSVHVNMKSKSPLFNELNSHSCCYCDQLISAHQFSKVNFSFQISDQCNNNNVSETKKRKIK